MTDKTDEADKVKATADIEADKVKATADIEAKKVKATADIEAKKVKATADIEAKKVKATADIEAKKVKATAVPPMSAVPEQPKAPISPVPSTESIAVLDYYYDDPAETTLHGPLLIPPLPPETPEFTVVGWKGYPDLTKPPISGAPSQAAQVWGAIATTLSYVMSLKNMPPYIKEWATTYNLVAIPRAGNQLNAYYDRSSLRFFWGKDPKTDKAIYTCDAVGIVSHELGHAILDSMRPDLWNTAVLECFAFHEAFGDILAIATVLQHDAVITHMLNETTNALGEIPNLWQTTVASRLAEQLGHAIYYTSNMVIGSEKYLRNSFNDFKYSNPLELKPGTSDATLTQEPHSFSRIFSGAWYECFCELFKSNYTNHNTTAAIIAVKEARDTMMRALLDTIIIAPSKLHLFRSVSTTIIEVLKKQNKTRELEIIKKVLIRRNLLDMNSLDDTTPTHNISTNKIDPSTHDHSMRANINTNNQKQPTSIQVELPKYVGMINGKDPVTGLGLRATVTKSVDKFLGYVSDHGLVGTESDNNMFAISGDKLVRNYICSSFCGIAKLGNHHPKIGNIN